MNERHVQEAECPQKPLLIHLLRKVENGEEWAAGSMLRGAVVGVGLGMRNFGSWGFRAGDIGELVGSVTSPTHLLSTSISRPLYCPLPFPSFSGTES